MRKITRKIIITQEEQALFDKISDLSMALTNHFCNCGTNLKLPAEMALKLSTRLPYGIEKLEFLIAQARSLSLSINLGHVTPVDSHGYLAEIVENKRTTHDKI